MPITYDDTLANARLTQVVTSCGSGATLEICTANYATVLAVIGLASPIGVVASRTLTFTVPESALAIGDGTATLARIRDGSSNIKISGLSVGTSNSDINLGATAAIRFGQTVAITSFIITHP